MARLIGVLGPRLHSVEMHPPRTCLDWAESMTVLKAGLTQAGLVSSSMADGYSTAWLCRSYLLQLA